MKRKVSGRLEAFFTAGLILACLACLWSFCGGIRAQAAQPPNSPNGSMLSNASGAAASDISGNDSGTGTGQPSASEDGSTAAVNWNITASPLYYGQPLKASALSGSPVDAGGNLLKGSFSWSEPEKLMMTVGDISTVVVFTPETETENGEIRYGEPCQINFWVTVMPGVPDVTDWCKINCKDAIYDGDTLEEATRLQGGQAVYEIPSPSRAKAKSVSGKFIWKEAGKKLETGTVSCELMFIPENSNLYQPVSTTVELEVLPRPVELRLDLSEKTVRTKDKILLAASVEKTKKLQALAGKIIFYADEKEIGEKKLTENESGWTAELPWETETAGEYVFHAEYIPADTHTAEAESGKIKAVVADPLSTLVTEKLPSGRVEKPYKAQLETDASGRLKVLFKLKEGALPEGLALNENSGEIAGTPKEAGEFVFTVCAEEKDVAVSREYRLMIEEKLVFSLICSDVSYGEQPSARVEAAPAQELRCTYTYEGIRETVYEQSDMPPSMPGTYRVSARIGEPEDYAGLELYQDFTIKKAVPKLSVTASPKELKDGGDCTLSITLQNPADPSEKENLPSGISVSFDKNVEVTRTLSGEGGTYALTFRSKPQNAKIRCSIIVEGNACYESAQAYIDVAVTKKEEPKADSGAGQQEKPSSGSGSTKQEAEAEPVPKTAEEVEAEFWQDVIFRIYKAQEKAETVTINAKGHGSLPDKVLDALRQHGKVTLALVWEGDMIVIPAGKALPYDKEHKNWTLAELSSRYPLTAAKPSGQQTKPEADVQQPETNAQPAQQPQTDAQPTQQSGTGTSAQTVQKSEAQGETDQNPPVHDATSETGSTETEAPQEKPAFTEVFRTADNAEAMDEVLEGSTVDWFLAAAGVCAVCGVLVVALAIAALANGKRRNGE